jgi:hypothetical protein
MRKCFAVITVVVLAGCLQLQAASVAIVNPSAEANVEAVPTGWTYYTTGGNWASATARSAAGRGIVADDGLNLFSIFNAGLTQTLGSTYQRGFTYKMRVDAAKRGADADGKKTGWGFGLYYDNGGKLIEVAQTKGVANWTDGTWQQKDLELTVNAGDACIGKAIVIKLFANPNSETSDYLDNVRLDAAPAPTTIGMAH